MYTKRKAFIPMPLSFQAIGKRLIETAFVIRWWLRNQLTWLSNYEARWYLDKLIWHESSFILCHQPTIEFDNFLPYVPKMYFSSAKVGKLEESNRMTLRRCRFDVCLQTGRVTCHQTPVGNRLVILGNICMDNSLNNMGEMDIHVPICIFAHIRGCRIE